MKTNSIVRTYFYTPTPLLLRDKEGISEGHTKTTDESPSIVLERHPYDLYHHFLNKLTSEMQVSEIEDEEKLRLLFEEIIKTKKLLEK